MRKTLKQKTINTGYRILTTTMIAGMTVTSIAAPAMAAESMPITDEAVETIDALNTGTVEETSQALTEAQANYNQASTDLASAQAEYDAAVANQAAAQTAYDNAIEDAQAAFDAARQEAAAAQKAYGSYPQ